MTMDARSHLALALILCAIPSAAASQDSPQTTTTAPQTTTAVEEEPTMEIYGFTMLDFGYSFEQINPNWFDTMRVTRLPKFHHEFGEDGYTWAGVRQSRFGAKTSKETPLGTLTTTFEFELFGVGVDEGQTTFRLRHAWGTLGDWGAGQYWTVFGDVDAFPNSIEYWGPTGLVWFRNVQVRYTPHQLGGQFVVALERPGASGDGGRFADRIELQNVQGRNVAPDVTAAYKFGAYDCGYVRVAGALRKLTWDDLLTDRFDLSGGDVGWGINLSSNINIGRDVVRLQYIFGEGVENYMNDAPIDVGVVLNSINPVRPLLGEALPVKGLSAFLDHRWNDRWTSAVGYSREDIDNTDGQRADSFQVGQYALANLLYMPIPDVMLGGELQWGRRENFTDEFQSDGWNIQFSFKWNFSWKLGE
jgi:hypothetical protein